MTEMGREGFRFAGVGVDCGGQRRRALNALERPLLLGLLSSQRLPPLQLYLLVLVENNFLPSWSQLQEKQIDKLEQDCFFG